ncbi:hypothetical protein Xoosp13_311 [Xanthomonas phage Xoo-sp13]|nr:hypothetical protein Xoosp13_311 [Xanthomonas phage Xoo-sp13]
MSDKVSKELQNKLQRALKTATSLGVEKIVVDNHSIRGDSQENSTMFILPFEAGTELDIGAMGITRVQELNSRIKLLKDEGTLLADFKTRDSGDKFVLRLVLKRDKTSIDFKCADPAMLKCPKALNDPDHFSFSFTKEDVDLMNSSKSVMKSDKVSFTSKDQKTVNFTISASEGDILSHELETDLDIKTDTDTFTVSYKTNILFPVLKELTTDLKKDTVTVTITRRGIMKLDVHGIPAYVFAEV